MGVLRRLAPACTGLVSILAVVLGGCAINPPRFPPARTAGLPTQVELTQVPFFSAEAIPLRTGRTGNRPAQRSVWPQLGLANLSYRRGDRQAAEGGYLAARVLDPRNVVAHNNLAEILSDRGCVSQTRAHAERAEALAKGTALEAAVAAMAQHVASATAADTGVSCPP